MEKSEMIDKKQRAVPVQERSRRRYELVLDTAGLVFAERGFQAATMQEIAEKAGTSIGSVYRFFPDKNSLFTALIERMVEREQVVLETLMSSAFSGSITDLIEHTFDLYAAFQRSEPGWRAVWMNLHLYQELGEASIAIEQEQLERIEQLIAFYAPAVDAARRQVIAMTIFDFLTGMLMLHERHDPSMHQALLVEAKQMLSLYARHLLEN